MFQNGASQRPPRRGDRPERSEQDHPVKRKGNRNQKLPREARGLFSVDEPGNAPGIVAGSDERPLPRRKHEKLNLNSGDDLLDQANTGSRKSQQGEFRRRVDPRDRSGRPKQHRGGLKRMPKRYQIV